MARECGRVKLLPFWLTGEWAMCSLVRMPRSWGEGSALDITLKVETSAALVLVTLLGATIKRPTRSHLRDEGLFWLLVQAGSPSWQECKVASCSGGSGSKERAMQDSAFSLSLIIYSGTPTLGVVPTAVRVSVLSLEPSENSWPHRNVQRCVT